MSTSNSKLPRENTDTYLLAIPTLTSSPIHTLPSNLTTNQPFTLPDHITQRPFIPVPAACVEILSTDDTLVGAIPLKIFLDTTNCNFTQLYAKWWNLYLRDPPENPNPIILLPMACPDSPNSTNEYGLLDHRLFPVSDPAPTHSPGTLVLFAKFCGINWLEIITRTPALNFLQSYPLPSFASTLPHFMERLHHLIDANFLPSLRATQNLYSLPITAVLNMNPVNSSSMLQLIAINVRSYFDQPHTVTGYTNNSGWSLRITSLLHLYDAHSCFNDPNWTRAASAWENLVTTFPTLNLS